MDTTTACRLRHRPSLSGKDSARGRPSLTSARTGLRPDDRCEFRPPRRHHHHRCLREALWAATSPRSRGVRCDPDDVGIADAEVGVVLARRMFSAGFPSAWTWARMTRARRRRVSRPAWCAIRKGGRRVHKRSRPSPDFNQELPIHQSVFNGWQMRLQLGSKRGIGGVAEPQPDYLQTGSLSRPNGKVCILRPDDRLHLSRLGFNLIVRSCAETKIVDVAGGIAFRGQPSRQPRRQLCVDQETHDQATRMTRWALAAAPKASAAFRSASLR